MSSTNTWMCVGRTMQEQLSRRRNRRIAVYVTIFTRYKTNKKTSKMSGLFVASCLSSNFSYSEFLNIHDMTHQFPNAVIQVFCKAPIPGQVKTRLMPELTATQAAQVHQQLTHRILDLVTTSNLCPVQLWCSPTLPHPFFKDITNLFSLPLFLQSSGDLGQRMHLAICSATQSFQHVVLIGCDCPSLTTEDLNEAINALVTDYDAVLAPAEDGGYCLIGVNTPQIELFNNITWGSSTVLDKTREKIQLLALNCLELKTQWDVDDYADYLRFTLLAK